MSNAGSTSGQVLARNVMLNLIGMLVPIVAGIICIPLAIRGLGDNGFGILSISWIILGYLTLFDFGLAKATMKFVAETNDGSKDNNRSAIIWTAVAIAFIMGTGGAVVIAAVSPYLSESLLKIDPLFIPEAKKAFFYVAISLPFMLVSTSIRGALGALQRFDLLNAIQVPVSVLTIVFPALSLPYGWSVSTVVLLIVITRSSASLGYLLLCLKHFSFYGGKFRWSSDATRKLLRYGGWITITGIISPILVFLDRFLIGSVISMTAVTLYTAPFEVVNRIRILPIALMRTFFPEFSALSSRNSDTEVETLATRAIKYVLLPVGVIALLLLVYAPEILELWLGNRFAAEASIVLRFFAAGILINSLAYIPFNLLQGVGRPDIPAKFHLMELPFYIIILWFLTKEFHIAGAACAWFIRVTIDFFLQFIMALKLYPGIIKNLAREKVLVEGVLLLCLGLLFYFWRLMAFGSLVAITGGIVFLAIFAAINWLLVLDEKEKRMVTRLPKILTTTGSRK